MKRLAVVLLGTVLIGLVGASYAHAGPGAPDGDGLIKKPGGTLKGDNVYNTTGDLQTVTRKVPAGQVTRFHWFVENDGSDGELTLKGASESKNFRVRYYDSSGTVISPEVKAGTYTQTWVADQREHFTVKIRAG